MQLKVIHIKMCMKVLNSFFESRAPFDIVLAKFFKSNKMGSHDRRSIAEFSYSVFRNFEKLKYHISNSSGTIDSSDCDLGRLYVISLLKMNKDHDLLNSLKLTDSERKFLGSMKSNFPQYAMLNYPEWMTPFLKRSFSNDDELLSNEMLALNDKALVDLRINTIKSTKEEVKNILIESGFQVEDCRYSCNGVRVLNARISRNHEVIAQGLAEIQDEGSQLVAEACAASAGDTVVDFCAGAGGKTLAIAAYMNNKGRIFALDKYKERLKNAQMRFKKANVNNVFCHEIDNKWIKRHLECADVVLVDAPCSGTGTWRRNADMRARFLLNDLQELIKVQAEILESACRLVKKGGKLVYATCSILRDENEDQIANFLQNHSEFAHQGIKLQNYSGDYLKLTPYHNQTDGFFTAVLLKADSV